MKTDPTQQSLDAAILDQKIAGIMGNKAYAYVAANNALSGKWAIGIATEGEHGYIPVGGWQDYEKMEDAHAFADGMNDHIGLSKLRAMEIVISSMRKPNKLRLRVEDD